jgi:hypothetical protein
MINKGFFMSVKHFLLIVGLLTSSLVNAGEPADIDAQFETTQCATPCKTPSKHVWWLLRSTDQIELRNVDKATGELSPRGEIWKHSKDGKLGYLFLMHDDKRAIEYLFDDLKILGINSDENKWQITSQLVADDELAHMKTLEVKTAPFEGFETVLYTGEINDAKVKVTWIPQLHIPVKIEYVYPSSTATVMLNKLISGSDLAIDENKNLRTTNDRLSSYKQIYFTDIGDMEQNAEAQVWIAKAKGAPGIHAHNH